MLRNFFSLAAVSVALVACNEAPEADVETREAEEVNEMESHTAATYALNTEGDEIHWTGFKTYADRVHTGNIQVQDGQFKVEDGKIVGGTFTIDMNSITNEDLPEEGDFNKDKLIGHLKSEDFFYTEKYPTASFTITQVEEAPADAAEGVTHMVSGNLEMRGNTKNITIPAKIDMDDNSISVSTPEFVIDRTKWEVMYNSDKGAKVESLAKEQLIDNNIKLELNLEADKS